jgi:hypothetical protein
MYTLVMPFDLGQRRIPLDYCIQLEKYIRERFGNAYIGMVLMPRNGTEEFPTLRVHFKDQLMSEKNMMDIMIYKLKGEISNG